MTVPPKVDIRPRKAWRVACRAISEDRYIYAASSRGKATATAVKQAQDVGYRVTFRHFRVTRAPEYDAWAATTDRNWGTVELFLADELSFSPRGVP